MTNLFTTILPICCRWRIYKITRWKLYYKYLTIARLYSKTMLKLFRQKEFISGYQSWYDNFEAKLKHISRIVSGLSRMLKLGETFVEIPFSGSDLKTKRLMYHTEQRIARFPGSSSKFKDFPTMNQNSHWNSRAFQGFSNMWQPWVSSSDQIPHASGIASGMVPNQNPIQNPPHPISNQIVNQQHSRNGIASMRHDQEPGTCTVQHDTIPNRSPAYQIHNTPWHELGSNQCSIQPLMGHQQQDRSVSLQRHTIPQLFPSYQMTHAPYEVESPHNPMIPSQIVSNQIIHQQPGGSGSVQYDTVPNQLPTDLMQCATSRIGSNQSTVVQPLMPQEKQGNSASILHQSSANEMTTPTVGMEFNKCPIITPPVTNQSKTMGRHSVDQLKFPEIGAFPQLSAAYQMSCPTPNISTFDFSRGTSQQQNTFQYNRSQRQRTSKFPPSTLNRDWVNTDQSHSFFQDLAISHQDIMVQRSATPGQGTMNLNYRHLQPSVDPDRQLMHSSVSVVESPWPISNPNQIDIQTSKRPTGYQKQHGPKSRKTSAISSPIQSLSTSLYDKHTSTSLTENSSQLTHCITHPVSGKDDNNQDTTSSTWHTENNSISSKSSRCMTPMQQLESDSPIPTLPQCSILPLPDDMDASSHRRMVNSWGLTQRQLKPEGKHKETVLTEVTAGNKSSDPMIQWGNEKKISMIVW